MVTDKVLSQWMSTLNRQEFSSIFWFLWNNTFDTILPEQVKPLIPLINELSKYDEDMYSLLWYEQPQSYLVVLQNTNEKRPNWWFFGSFALVKLHKWEVQHLEIIDSYLPWYDNPNTSITWPEWFNEFLPKREIYFVWANKVGFTYHDWAHIKTLYEKSYPWQRIRWVVFLTTDMFTKILPNFEDQLREWQFVNASIDLIRWEVRRWKKEVYLKSSQAFFEENKEVLIKWFVEHLPEILDNHWINFYLVDITWPFHGFLRRNKLTTRFEQETAYFRDSNISFNKIDNFVTKTITCFDEDERTAIEVTNKNIVSLLPLSPGEWTCKIANRLEVTQEHIDRIRSLEQQYWITLWAREQHILWFTQSRDSRGVVHFPKNIEIFQVTWDTYESELFDTPFSNAVMYKATIWQNWWSANVFIRFRVLDNT